MNDQISQLQTRKLHAHNVRALIQKYPQKEMMILDLLFEAQSGSTFFVVEWTGDNTLPTGIQVGNILVQLQNRVVLSGVQSVGEYLWLSAGKTRSHIPHRLLICLYPQQQEAATTAAADEGSPQS